MANHPGRRKVTPPAPAERDFLVQTRVNRECEDKINDAAAALGLRPGTWLRMHLYNHFGIAPTKEKP
jgi:hypothetical protein